MSMRNSNGLIMQKELSIKISDKFGDYLVTDNDERNKVKLHLIRRIKIKKKKANFDQVDQWKTILEGEIGYEVRLGRSGNRRLDSDVNSL